MPADQDSLPASLPAAIARRLEQEVITLVHAPGAWLREEEVSARFGVSRSPVREAMRVMEADGLLLRHPRRGTQVPPMTRADLDAISACRLPLEGLASAGAAAHASPSAIARLREKAAAMAAAEKAEDAAAAFAANVAITDTLHAECGNPVLTRLLSGLDKLAMRYRYASYRHLPEVLHQAVEANLALAEAIASRDPQGAQRLTEGLIRANWDRLAALFESGWQPGD
ncbi:GntR family transcriptional regulator [Acetobacteraceae bacterium H6797]|nr:GntR family transcriptional regulator [Acetobacteraceae bacterium H6797]